MAVVRKLQLLHRQLKMRTADRSGAVANLLSLQAPGDGDKGFVPGKTWDVTQQLLLHIPTESGQEGKSSKGCLTQ